MKAEIDLDEIIQEHLGNGFNPIQKQATRFVMRKGIEQALDIASEEATIWVESDINGTEFDKAEFGDDGFKEKVTVYKPSILKIKERVK